MVISEQLAAIVIRENGNVESLLSFSALYCKGLVPDDVRKKWLIEVAKRGEKVDNDESPIKKKQKITNQLITSHY